MLCDITLAALNYSLQSAVNPSLEIINTVPVSGGCINLAYQCQTNQGQPYFVKVNQANNYSMFEAEAYGLNALRSTKTIEIPEVIALGKSASHSYLILSYLPLSSLKNNYLFGKQLAKMHSHSAAKYGFETDNFIGTTPQHNSWHDNWYEFFMSNRLEYQCHMLEENKVNQRIRALWPAFKTACQHIFSDHQPSSAILHGDLWQGNVAQTDSEICLFDPATYYGDAETDLAMLTLFGNPGEGFYQGYESIKPLCDGHSKRRVFYNLYHVLNHSNLFGSSYSQQAFAMMQQIMHWDVR